MRPVGKVLGKATVHGTRIDSELLDGENENVLTMSSVLMERIGCLRHLV